ncbi:MAG: amidohydrolase [Gemmatimonas sp. SG8_17]|nr:MAG: amidohydrolase [Gemmatimonas sp. SG8_17]
MQMPVAVFAQDDKAMVLAQIESRATRYGEIAQEIWDLAELGYLEEQSSALLQSTLAQAGFTLDVGVADIPTAFVASFGNGRPVVAILAEFDALPGITQARVPVRQPLTDSESGHACGHHLFGTGSTAAAIAVKEWLQATNTPGTIRLYGTPAEEGGSGKVYMVRAGLFDDVDVVLHWHPGDRNGAGVYSTLAIESVKFRFHGVSAHAAAAPHLARSALDGVEAMNVMVNMMREHVPQETRIHYVITGGGAAPNVTPDFAEVYYYLRHPDSDEVQHIFERVVKAAEGAALGTGTTVDYELTGGTYALLPNEVLARAMQANLEQVGGVEYDAAEREFAETLRATLPKNSPPPEAAAQVDPFVVIPGAIPASTDVGDVSWVVPTVGLSAATWVPGTSAHTWQAIAAGGMSIGNKGMLVAAKTIALTAVDLFTNKELIASAREEYQRRVGPDFEYVPLLGNRAPPLDYRKRPGS